jgi:hypothetical protein
MKILTRRHEGHEDHEERQDLFASFVSFVPSCEPRLAAAVALLFALTACAATQQPDAVAPTAPGFLLGLWHGFIFPVAWLVSLFAPKVAVYAVPNNGGWYDFGYFLGIVVFGVGARKSHIVYRDRVIDVRARRID